MTLSEPITDTTDHAALLAAVEAGWEAEPQYGGAAQAVVTLSEARYRSLAEWNQKLAVARQRREAARAAVLAGRQAATRLSGLTGRADKLRHCKLLLAGNHDGMVRQRFEAEAADLRRTIIESSARFPTAADREANTGEGASTPAAPGGDETSPPAFEQPSAA